VSIHALGEVACENHMRQSIRRLVHRVADGNRIRAKDTLKRCTAIVRGAAVANLTIIKRFTSDFSLTREFSNISENDRQWRARARISPGETGRSNQMRRTTTAAAEWDEARSNFVAARLANANNHSPRASTSRQWTPYSRRNVLVAAAHL